MSYSNENDKCLKCNTKLKSNEISYIKSHDGDVYRAKHVKVDERYAHKVPFGYLCQDCYKEIPNKDISHVINECDKFLNNELEEAIEDVRRVYESKLDKLNQIREYVEKGKEIINNKKCLGNMTKEELNFLSKNLKIYNPAVHEIFVGFIRYSGKNDIKEMLEI